MKTETKRKLFAGLVFAFGLGNIVLGLLQPAQGQWGTGLLMLIGGIILWFNIGLKK